MKALEVYLNGKLLCRAGMQNPGVLSAVLSLRKVHIHEDVMFHVAAQPVELTSNAYQQWINQGLDVNDEVVIKVVDIDPDQADNPQEIAIPEELKKYYSDGDEEGIKCLFSIHLSKFFNKPDSHSGTFAYICLYIKISNKHESGNKKNS
ncbi:MAG: hypothetical protein HC880_10360 [Bacteroidia bacterium]|nr:hypothetical protein [Bacteroidia bacterium]